MSKLPCEVVRDLFPSYIDELTGEVTNNMVEEHVSECEDCKKMLDVMKNPVAEPTPEKGKEEIDFLKKTRSKNRENVWLAVMIAVIALSVVFLVKNYFVGTKVSEGYIACQVMVEDNVLTVNCAVADASLSIYDISFTEENGVVSISCASVKRSPFYENSMEKQFVASKEIKEVRLGKRILWAEGENISAITSAVFQTAHPYIGDMPANGRTANALNMGMVLGPYKNELQTSTEPYEWKFILQEEVTSLLDKEIYMDACAKVLLALVDNLGVVTYEYTCAGIPMVFTITAESATKAVGQDIKSFGKNIVALEKLIRDVEILGGYVVDYSQWNPGEGIKIELTNLSAKEISSIALTGYTDDGYMALHPKFTQTMCNADGSMLEKGDVIYFELLPEDFADEDWNPGDYAILGITLTLKDGTQYSCKEMLTIPLEFGYTYRYQLTGNTEEGYYINQ